KSRSPLPEKPPRKHAGGPCCKARSRFAAKQTPPLQSPQPTAPPSTPQKAGPSASTPPADAPPAIPASAPRRPHLLAFVPLLLAYRSPLHARFLFPQKRAPIHRRPRPCSSRSFVRLNHRSLPVILPTMPARPGDPPAEQQLSFCPIQI